MIRSSGGDALGLFLCVALAVASSACGGNVCENADEHVAECLGATDDDDEEEIPDEDCTENIEAEAECILDAECDEINSGAVYERCATAE
jgi:hypothetical protein